MAVPSWSATRRPGNAGARRSGDQRPRRVQLHLVRTGAETDGELLEGEVRTIIGGTERRYASGEKFEVPAGTPHQMGAEKPARLRWEVTPALRTAEFFEQLFGGGERVGSSMADVIAEFGAEFRLSAEQG